MKKFGIVKAMIALVRCIIVQVLENCVKGPGNCNKINVCRLGRK